MSFLLTVPSLKKMAAVQVCGNLWKTERPIRGYIDIEDSQFQEWWEEEEEVAKIEHELTKHLSLLELPRSLEKELYPFIKRVGERFFEFGHGFDSVFEDVGESFFINFLGQVQFSNRGDVNTFATTKRQLQEDGALRQVRTHHIFTWTTIIGDPEIIKSELNRNREQVYASLTQNSGCELFWLRYVDERFPEFQISNTIPIATHQQVLNRMIDNGFQEGIDFTFSMLTKAAKLSLIEESGFSISPIAWARLILQLETSQEREAFYREHGYSLLLCIVRSWMYHDLFRAAVVELVSFLSVEHFETVALELASLVSRSVRPYDKSAGDMFVFYWESVPESLRLQFNENKLTNLMTCLSKETIVNSQPRCFVLVVRDLERLQVLRAFLLSDEGSSLCAFLIKGRFFKCLRLFRDYVSVAHLATTHQDVLTEINMDFNELYHALHVD